MASRGMTPAVEFRDVWKSFGAGFAVLRGASFGLDEGEIALLIGENGAGKTTSFNLASGIARPDHGVIMLSGECVNGRGPTFLWRRGVRRMYQRPAVFPSLSIRDNVLLATHAPWHARFVPWPFTGVRVRQWKRIEAECSALFEACGFLESPMTSAGELSIGQQRILEFLRVFSSSLGQAKVVLLDEPFAAVHEEVIPVMFRMIEGLAAAGAAVVVIEHQHSHQVFNGVQRMYLDEGTIRRRVS